MYIQVVLKEHMCLEQTIQGLHLSDFCDNIMVSEITSRTNQYFPSEQSHGYFAHAEKNYSYHHEQEKNKDSIEFQSFPVF